VAKALKVLMLIENCPVPADNRVWAEACALRDDGCDVSIIGPKGASKHQESYICLEGIHVYRYRLPRRANSPGAYMLEYSITLLMTFLLSWKVLFRHGFDVIHAANPPDIFFLVGLLYQVLGKKFIFDQHDLSPEMFQMKFSGRAKLLRPLLRFLEWASYRTAHVTITTNLSQKRFALERGHCQPDRVFIVRNGPDVRRLARVPPEPALKQGRCYVLAYVGEMEVQDGIDYALRALQTLVYARAREDVLLVLMGDGGYAPALRALAHELQLDTYTHFTGWLDAQDLVRYLSVADVGLVPDPRNGLNEYCTMVKTMEYMALGLPVVAFDLPETRFSAQDAAIYATPNSVEDFASKINILLDDQALRLDMSAAGRERIAGGLSWDHDRQSLLQAYRYCLKKQLPGDRKGRHERRK
jgi:glycosyltransferase involved in cell wall biosynthesis